MLLSLILAVFSLNFCALKEAEINFSSSSNASFLTFIQICSVKGSDNFRVNTNVLKVRSVFIVVTQLATVLAIFATIFVVAQIFCLVGPTSLAVVSRIFSTYFVVRLPYS